MSSNIRTLLAAAVLVGSASTAFAGYESFDVDIYRGNPVPEQTLAVHGNTLNSFGQGQTRIERRPAAAVPAVSPAEEGWMDRASKLY